MPVDLQNRPVNPFQSQTSARVFVFVRTDCPITNRYAPELVRIADKYRSRSVDFWLVYPDRTETTASIHEHIGAYKFPGTPLRDVDHFLVRRAQVTVAPEAAVFDQSGKLRYHGRIDDRWVDFGKSRPTASVHDLDDAIDAILGDRKVQEEQTQAIGCTLADVQ
jgi:hypothetical protein